MDTGWAPGTTEWQRSSMLSQGAVQGDLQRQRPLNLTQSWLGQKAESWETVVKSPGEMETSGEEVSSSGGEVPIAGGEMSTFRDGMSTSEGVLKTLEMEGAHEEIVERRTTKIASSKNRGGMLTMLTTVRVTTTITENRIELEITQNFKPIKVGSSSTP